MSCVREIRTNHGNNLTTLKQKGAIMKLITVNRSVRRLSNKEVEALADSKGGVYAQAAAKETKRRTKKRDRRISRPAAA